MPFFLLSSQSCSRALIRSTNHLPEVPSVCFLKPPCLYFAFFLPPHLRIINCCPSLTTLWVEFSPSFLVRIKHDPSVLPVAFPISQWNYFALKQLLENWNPRPLENWDPASAFAQDLSGCFKPPENTSSRFLGVYFCGAEEQRIFYPDLSVRGVWRCKMRDHKGSHLLCTWRFLIFLHFPTFWVPLQPHGSTNSFSHLCDFQKKKKSDFPKLNHIFGHHLRFRIPSVYSPLLLNCYKDVFRLARPLLLLQSWSVSRFPSPRKVPGWPSEGWALLGSSYPSLASHLAPQGHRDAVVPWSLLDKHQPSPSPLLPWDGALSRGLSWVAI